MYPWLHIELYKTNLPRPVFVKSLRTFNGWIILVLYNLKWFVPQIRDGINHRVNVLPTSLWEETDCTSESRKNKTVLSRFHGD